MPTFNDFILRRTGNSLGALNESSLAIQLPSHFGPFDRCLIMNVSNQPIKFKDMGSYDAVPAGAIIELSKKRYNIPKINLVDFYTEVGGLYTSIGTMAEAFERATKLPQQTCRWLSKRWYYNGWNIGDTRDLSLYVDPARVKVKYYDADNILYNIATILRNIFDVRADYDNDWLIHFGHGELEPASW